MPSKTNVVIPNARLSYLFVFNKNSNDKYSCAILLPKSDAATKRAIDKAIEAARIAGADKFGGKVPTNLNTTVYDGDEPKPDGTERGPECKGMWIINASAQQQPGLVDRRCHDIMDSTQLYSGCWANVDVNFYAYNTKTNRGIACGLNNIQKVRDDEALGGRARARDVFSALDDEEEDDGLGL